MNIITKAKTLTLVALAIAGLHLSLPATADDACQTCSPAQSEIITKTVCYHTSKDKDFSKTIKWTAHSLRLKCRVVKQRNKWTGERTFTATISGDKNLVARFLDGEDLNLQAGGDLWRSY
jgi:hypothetical protein